MEAKKLRHDLEDALNAVEVLAKAFNVPPFEVYLLGGAGCVLAGYFERATRDFDIIDLEYSASLGIVMKPLEPFDLIDPQLATLSSSYKNRATRLPKYEFLSVYVLSREDIIISKVSRLNERDLCDIGELLPSADISLVIKIAGEVILQNLIPSVKNTLIENLAHCMEVFNVSNHVQQLEKLRKRF
ncbi:MAG: DUF6036 family nucleotidyltransferase [Defluviitaleaceae bacterium]|nr:DUF6036 family nucleotidyltransferase [Defluviitaleaceae bacterium]